MDTLLEFSYAQQCLVLLVELLVPFVAECFLYGIYAAFMTVCWTALRRRDRIDKELHLFTLLLLFLLSSAHLATSIITMSPLLKATFGSLTQDYEKILLAFISSTLEYDTISVSLFMTSNIVVGGLLIYRCCMIWGSHRTRYIILLPTLLLLLTAGSAISALLPSVWHAGYSPLCQMICYSAILAENVLVTTLMAWRIWQVKHKTEGFVSDDVQQRYSRTISIIIESGIIYPAFMIVYIILAFDSRLFFRTLLARRVIFACLTQLVGIVPTLIMLRAGLDSRDTVHSVLALQTPTMAR